MLNISAICLPDDREHQALELWSTGRVTIHSRVSIAIIRRHMTRESPLPPLWVPLHSCSSTSIG